MLNLPRQQVSGELERPVPLAVGGSSARPAEPWEKTPLETRELLCALGTWYAEQCDGDREHEFGVKIETLDNPGWLIQVDLPGTSKEGVTLAPELAEETDGSWLHSSADGSILRIACGPKDLERAVRAALKFLTA
ncbi:Imm53 family immunity protein [Streptomyces sp. 184]|uniref:Imm53 family immunity protein n=1 Tax=Streptomyces sp. 184 TaxID=1827526 RepID=UPI0038912DE9